MINLESFKKSEEYKAWRKNMDHAEWLVSACGGNMWKEARVYFNGVGPSLADFYYDIKSGQWFSTNKRTRKSSITKFVNNLENLAREIAEEKELNQAAAEKLTAAGVAYEYNEFGHIEIKPREFWGREIGDERESRVFQWAVIEFVGGTWSFGGFGSFGEDIQNELETKLRKIFNS